MEGVTTAIVAFVFVCILFPRLIENRPQYYVAFACVLGIIILDALQQILLNSANVRGVLSLAIAVLQIVAIILLFLSAGGLTVRGLTKEMASAFEVVRRGETQKETIIPIGNREGGGGGGSGSTPRRREEEKPRERVDLNAETGGQAYPARKPAAPPPAKAYADDDPDDGPIPMD